MISSARSGERAHFFETFHILSSLFLPAAQSHHKTKGESGFPVMLHPDKDDENAQHGAY